MVSLSKAFDELAHADERRFAAAGVPDGLLRKTRNVRRRNRAFQTAGATFAAGGLAVGGTVAWGAVNDRLNVAVSPAASATGTASPTPTSTPSPTSVAPVATRDVRLDTWSYQSVQHVTLGQFDEQFACGAPAPKPTSGRVQATLGDVSIRPDAWVIDLSASADPLAVADADGYTSDLLIADASVSAAQGESFAAQVPASLVVLTQNGTIVAIVAPGRVDPRSPVRTIDDPNDAQPIQVVEYGIHALLGSDPTSFTTGYGGWKCPANADMGADYDPKAKTLTYAPLGDYVEPGEYQAFLVARVIANNRTAAETYVAEQGMDLWSYFSVADQADQRGWAHSSKKVSGSDGTFTHVLVTVPVPETYLTDDPLDTVVVSQPVTVTLP